MEQEQGLRLWLEEKPLVYTGHLEGTDQNAGFIERIRDRHSLLVDKKSLKGLTQGESDELTQINHLLDVVEEEYYAPIKEVLAKAIVEVASHACVPVLRSLCECCEVNYGQTNSNVFIDYDAGDEGDWVCWKCEMEAMGGR